MMETQIIQMGVAPLALLNQIGNVLLEIPQQPQVVLIYVEMAKLSRQKLTIVTMETQPLMMGVTIHAQ
jgi:hypothetical protein